MEILKDIKGIRNLSDLIVAIKSVFFSRFGKVFIAGGFGASSQLLTYGIIFQPLFVKSNILNLNEVLSVFGQFDLYPKFFFAQLLAIEIGVFVSFYINNSWAFSDKKLKGKIFLRRFLKNHLVVSGAILIQLVIGQLLSTLFGISVLKDYIYQIIGILVGLIWNFYFYQKVIWKTK